MHWVVPFASDLSEACRQVLQDLRLPNLERLLSRCTLAARDDGDAASFSPPHERALAKARGWHGGDGMLPFAAHAAAADGIDIGARAWGLLTPSHWQLGRDHVTLLDPDTLTLDDAESRVLFESLRQWLEGDGFVAAWGAPTRWYAARDDLDGVATASLDRAIHRDVDAWLRASQPGGTAPRESIAAVRRLQSEAQLLFHTHPVNEAREVPRRVAGEFVLAERLRPGASHGRERCGDARERASRAVPARRLGGVGRSLAGARRRPDGPAAGADRERDAGNAVAVR